VLQQQCDAATPSSFERVLSPRALSVSPGIAHPIDSEAADGLAGLHLLQQRRHRGEVVTLQHQVLQTEGCPSGNSVTMLTHHQEWSASSRLMTAAATVTGMMSRSNGARISRPSNACCQQLSSPHLNR
jgi:hypothetical protein